MSLLILGGFTGSYVNCQLKKAAYLPPADFVPFTLQIEVYEIEWGASGNVQNRQGGA